jgi:hypothetical protein
MILNTRKDNCLKVFLDDERDAPEGWVFVNTPDSVIALLEAGMVSHLSLDHDLGDDEGIGTGYDVVLWLEEQVFNGEKFENLETITVHSANASARIKMEQGIESIEVMRGNA